MVMRTSAQSGSQGGTWKGVLLLLVLTAVSVLNVDILGRSISFIFLPLMAIFLWPRIDKPIASIIFILVFGLLLDILSAGPLGLWALIFLSVFTLFAPHKRVKSLTFSSAIYMWLLVLLFALVSAYFLGCFAIKSRPQIMPMLYQAIAAIILFPLVYGLRHFAKNLLSGSDRGSL